MWSFMKETFELPLDCSKCQVLIFSYSNACFFIRAEVKRDTLSHGEQPLSVTVARFPAMTQRSGEPFWHSESWEQKTATAARQRLVAMTTAKATGRPVSLAGWFVWREKFTWKILQRLSFSVSHTINGREWMWPNILNVLSHQPPANRTHTFRSLTFRRSSGEVIGRISLCESLLTAKNSLNSAETTLFTSWGGNN